MLLVSASAVGLGAVIPQGSTPSQLWLHNSHTDYDKQGSTISAALGLCFNLEWHSVELAYWQRHSITDYTEHDGRVLNRRVEYSQYSVDHL